MIFDFHAHLLFKDFNSSSIYDKSQKPPDGELVKEHFRPNRNISKLKSAFAKEINTTSQLHFKTLSKSQIRCVCAALYPLEQVFAGFKK